MRSAAVLISTPDFSVREVTCRGGERHWSSPELSSEHSLVLVRSGMFQLRADGQESLVETTTAYLQAPGRAFEFAHPRGGDICTSVSVSTDLWQVNFADHSGVAALPVDAHVEMAHLMLLRAARGGDAQYDAAERLLSLLGQAVRAEMPIRRLSDAGARLVGAAREAIAANDPHARSLVDLARYLGVSPFHLSRTFTAHTGTSLTRHRNRVRVSRALHRLLQGEDDLGRLAADLGFADQAHLTRTVKSHAGQPPASLRTLLGGSRRGRSWTGRSAGTSAPPAGDDGL